MLSFIARNTDYKTPEAIRTLLIKRSVRPHVQYTVHLWSANYQMNEEKPEQGQKSAMKLIPFLGNMSNEEMLRRLNHFSLKKRRLHGDLIRFQNSE